ncbi:hypothetical protein NCCP2145_40480 [Pseudarthrobacter sp. NCCP-2145]|nr:hypothetical protein NCCP2145_40480 [Pseudarthrobacter sp. NCCP-2145]
MRIASAIREYTATRRGAPGWAATGWDRNRAASWCTLCLALLVVVREDFQPTGVTGLLDKLRLADCSGGPPCTWGA